MHVTHGPCVRGLGHPDTLPENNHLHWAADGEDDPWVDPPAWANSEVVSADGKITWAR